jgi:hypothetical protein
MAGFSDLFGLVVTGAKDVLVAKESNKELAKQYENDALRASIKQAEQQRQRELSVTAQFQDYLNQNNQVFFKILNVLLVTVAGSLIGVIFMNLFKKGRG